MSDYGEVFSKEPPIPKRHSANTTPHSDAQAPKRKYTRKAKPQPTDESMSTSIVIPEQSAVRFSSHGIEYMTALINLLSLIAEPQRSKLVDFIINEKIV